jgi:hypothetical protein
MTMTIASFSQCRFRFSSLPKAQKKNWRRKERRKLCLSTAEYVDGYYQRDIIRAMSAYLSPVREHTRADITFGDNANIES